MQFISSSKALVPASIDAKILQFSIIFYFSFILTSRIFFKNETFKFPAIGAVHCSANRGFCE
jgi:hypothetical protein